MTEDEAFAFMRDSCMVAFPSIRAWVLKNAKDYERTVRMWSTALNDFTREECDAVIHDWVSGRLEMPKFAYQEERIAVMIRDVIQKRRHEAAQRAARRAARAEPLSSAPAGSMSLVEVFQAIRDITEQVRVKEMSAEQFEARKKELLESVGK